ncbi:hypothetical protein WJX77_000679 [Trebouxia sp. C0004]
MHTLAPHTSALKDVHFARHHTLPIDNKGTRHEGPPSRLYAATEQNLSLKAMSRYPDQLWLKRLGRPSLLN